MKLKDVVGKLVKNKKNGQVNVAIRKNKLKSLGISEDELLNMNIDGRLRKLFE